ncbi:MAG: aminodeoxychorismate/anthranilate synthase component II [Gammaproteobacteria bacterium]|nr:aminodeoxychorismate/anthranilate synthase component II [Gammaproteobacteria bacterium]
MSKVLFIDNFDSFTYNLVEEFRLLNFDVTVVRNSVDISELTRIGLEHDLIVLSPGPGGPSDAGNSLQLLQELNGKVPFLGICLGHQIIAQFAGAEVSHAPMPVHGKVAVLKHNGEFCFSNLPREFNVARYHSLIVKELPKDFICLATTNQLIMAIYHPTKRLIGFQFHPESILTTRGALLLKQTVDLLVNSDSSTEQYKTQ